MARRKKKIDRGIKPDAKYSNVTVSRFVNYIMRKGKKSIATRIVYDCFEVIKEKTKRDPLEVFEESINKVAPLLEIKSKRVGGATYQVPVEVRGDRRMQLAFLWIINAAKGKKGRPMANRLADEFIDIMNGTGTAIKKRDDVQKMAEANRAFAHFAR